MAQVNLTKNIQTVKCGNGLVVTQNVTSDSILIRVSNPYILLPDKASLSKVCSWCLLPVSSNSVSDIGQRCVSSLKKCSACKIPQYCSSTCQRTDWKSIHGKECARLALLPDVPPTPVRAAMRVLLQHRFGSKLDPRWANLVGHEEKLMERSQMKQFETWADVMLQAKAALKFSGTEETASIGVATALLCRISCNAFRVTLPHGNPIGLCFEPTIALVNHSCMPNARVDFEGRVMTLSSLVPIKKDEELLISYIDNMQPCNIRREDLWGTYYFWCRCYKCEQEAHGNAC